MKTVKIKNGLGWIEKKNKRKKLNLVGLVEETVQISVFM